MQSIKYSDTDIEYSHAYIVKYDNIHSWPHKLNYKHKYYAH